MFGWIQALLGRFPQGNGVPEARLSELQRLTGKDAGYRRSQDTYPMRHRRI